MERKLISKCQNVPWTRHFLTLHGCASQFTPILFNYYNFRLFFHICHDLFSQEKWQDSSAFYSILLRILSFFIRKNPAEAYCYFSAINCFRLLFFLVHLAKTLLSKPQDIKTKCCFFEANMKTQGWGKNSSFSMGKKSLSLLGHWFRSCKEQNALSSESVK